MFDYIFMIINTFKKLLPSKPIPLKSDSYFFAKACLFELFQTLRYPILAKDLGILERCK